MNVKHKLRILYDVHPEPQRKAANTEDRSIKVLLSFGKYLPLIFLPITLPGVTDIWVTDLSFIGLFIQEVKHVFDGQWKGRTSMSGAKHCLEEVIHKLLECPLEA